MKTYKSDEVFFCPHCNEEQEDQVIDWTIPGQVGDQSTAKDQCWSCDGEFRVTNNSDGTCTVSGIITI